MSFDVPMSEGTPDKFFLRYEVQEREQEPDALGNPRPTLYRACLVGDRGEKPLHDWTADQTEAQRLFDEAVEHYKGMS